MRVVLACLVLTGCADSEEARLDHAQILAVRTEPAHVAPGGRARIEVLAGDDAGAVFVTDPDALVASGSVTVERTAGGWFVTAGAAAELARLEITLAIDGVAWRAEKALVVGEVAANPRVAAMQLDGATASGELVAARGSKPALTAVGEGAGELSYAWYSSIGDLAFYRQPVAVLDAADPVEGHVLVVVRDAAGGVGWQLVPAAVR